MTFRALCDKAKGIRLPVHVHGKLSEVLRARDELQQELGKEPTIEEIAERMEMTEEIARAFSVEQDPEGEDNGYWGKRVHTTITRERIRQIAEEALEKLRERSNRPHTFFPVEEG